MSKGFSGKSGTVLYGSADSTPGSEAVEVIKWTLDSTVAVNKYNSNTTAGHKRAVGGVRDTKGTIEIKVASDAGPQLAPGDEVSLRLDVDDTENNYFLINHAVIAGAPIECDIDGGAIVSLTYAFEASDIAGAGILAAFS